ncbi:MAG: hypothetical protein LUF30_12485 [Lachnospiraceae bacterium]|nr:hypothetical protein [Lachnospiraceae bacterium]
MMKRLGTYIRQDMKLIYKVLFIILLAVLIPAVVTTLIFYNWFYQNTVETVLESRLMAVGTAEARIEDMVENLRDVADAVSGSDLLQRALTMEAAALQTIYEDDDETTDDWLDTYKAILSARLEDEDIQSICIYCDEETEVLNELGNQFTEVEFFVPLSEIEYTYWKTILDITDESSRLFSGFYLSEQERSQYGGTAYVQKVQYSKLGEWKTAYVAVYCGNDNITGILLEYGTLEGELAYVLDSRNVIVTPYEEDFVLYIEDYETLEETFPEGKTFYTRSYGGEAVYACRYVVDSLDWALIWVIPESAIAGESRTLLVSALGTYGLLIILGIAAEWWISWRMLVSIYRLE